MDLGGLIGVVLSLGGGVVGNLVGKSDKVGGKKKLNRILAPAAAIMTGAGYYLATGNVPDLPPELATGGTAIFGYSVVKNFLTANRED